MAFITRKITRTSQPQELVGVDRTSDIGAKLLDFYVPNQLADPRNVGSVAVPQGLAFNFTGANELAVNSLPNTSVTVMAGIYVSDGVDGDSAGEYIFGGNYNGSDESFTFRLRATLTVEASTYPGGQVTHTVSLALDTYAIVFALMGGTDTTSWRAGQIVDGAESSTTKTFTAQLRAGRPVHIGAGDFNGTPWRKYSKPIVWVATFAGHLTESERAEVARNPWQFFEPESETIWIPDGVSITLPTLVQPASTTSAGAWTATGAATLHEAIDEATPSDADYISVAAASTCEMVLAESAFPTGNVSLAYRALSSTASTLTVTLKQGATTIMTRTHALTGTATLYTQPLTAGEVAAIVAGPITCTLTSS